MSILSEFKTFVARGNVVDLAVGVVVGAAFSKIVESLVKDVVTPPLGLLIGGVDFAVGVVVGAAFSKIVESLVKDVVTPPLGLLIGGFDFTELKASIEIGVL